ncbi:hypothetical protein PTKIN_Ptkin01aG0154000 [Pterospermum kingtungense]
MLQISSHLVFLQYPLLYPGEGEFVYESCAPLSTSSGSIEGAVVCSQYKGNRVNSVNFFNGEFKAGDSCCLCESKKEMLFGNCNGVGFVRGFRSTSEQ